MTRPQTFETTYDDPYVGVTAIWRNISPDGKAIFVAKGSETIRIPRASSHGADEAKTLRLEPGDEFSFRMLAKDAEEMGLGPVRRSAEREAG